MKKEIKEYLKYYEKTKDTSNLWRWEEEELNALLIASENALLHELSLFVEEIVCRYITFETLPKTLEIAIERKRKKIIEKGVIEFNALKLDGELYFQRPEFQGIAIPGDHEIGFYFHEFTYRIVEIFETFKKIISYIKVAGKHSLDSKFKDVLKMVNSLKGLDLSDSIAFSPYFYEIPKGVKQVLLKRVSWLTQEEMKRFLECIKGVEYLSLAFNNEIDFKSFGELSHLNTLEGLDLTGCYQIEDEWLKMILSAVRGLSKLSIASCSKIREEGFHSLAAMTGRLECIDLSNTRIDDGSLIEILYRNKDIQVVLIDHVEGITEFGIKQILKMPSKLKVLSLKESDLNVNFLKEIEREALEKKIQVIC